MLIEGQENRILRRRAKTGRAWEANPTWCRMWGMEGRSGGTAVIVARFAPWACNNPRRPAKPPHGPPCVSPANSQLTTRSPLGRHLMPASLLGVCLSAVELTPGRLPSSKRRSSRAGNKTRLARGCPRPRKEPGIRACRPMHCGLPLYAPPVPAEMLLQGFPRHRHPLAHFRVCVHDTLSRM
jgi:hypothetical protein